MTSNPQSHLESQFLTLKGLGMLGSKPGVLFTYRCNWSWGQGLASYNCPRELSCTAMRPWLVKSPTTQCVSLQSTCSATCIDTVVTAVTMHLEPQSYKEGVGSLYTLLYVIKRYSGLKAKIQQSSAFLIIRQSNSKIMFKISWPQAELCHLSK